MDRSPDALLAGLTPAQRAAVTNDAGVLCVVAGAGSGKTTVLTRRIAWRALSGSADAEHVLVVTFTRQAAAELRARLARLGVSGVWAGTFHAAAFAQLRRHWADNGMRAPGLAPDPQRILRAVVAEEPGLGDDALAPLAAELSWARARMVGPEGYPEAAAAARRRSGLPAEQVARVLARYDAEKRRRSVIDLDDLVVECARVLEAGGTTAAAVRWRFRHLFVDEFQDVNPAQWRLLTAWRDGRDDLCVVGDPRQAVYAWNGADPSLLRRLPTVLPGAGVVRLDENHRSSGPIVSAAAAVLRDARGRAAGRGGDPAGGAGGTAGEDEHGGDPVAAGTVEGPPPMLRGFEDDEAEAAAVTRWVRTARRPGEPWRHVAVLARTNARLDAVASALGRAGISVRRAGARRHDPEASAVVRALRAGNRSAPVRPALLDALAEAGDPPAATELLAALCDEYEAEDPTRSVGGFLAWLAANPGAMEPARDEDAVVLTTFHRAKGLEWTAVAVVGLEDGTVPIAYAEDPAALAEEHRLFYVALTRATRELWCSWAAATGGGDRRRLRKPSPFLDAVRTAATAEAPPPPEVAAEHIAALRGRLAAAG